MDRCIKSQRESKKPKYTLEAFDALLQCSSAVEVHIPEKPAVAPLSQFTPRTQHWKSHPVPERRTLMHLLLNMYLHNIRPTLIVMVDGKQYFCHTMVLRIISKFIRSLKQSHVLNLPSSKVSARAFVAIYRWALDPCEDLSYAMFMDIFRAAMFLRIDELVTQSWMLLDVNAKEEDRALLLYEAGNKISFNMEDTLFGRINCIFLTYVASLEFAHLPIKSLKNLLYRGTIAVNSEMEVFMAVMMWLAHDWDKRKPLAVEVMQCVRFELLPFMFLLTFRKRRDCSHLEELITIEGISSMFLKGLDDSMNWSGKYQGRMAQSDCARKWIYDRKCSYHHSLGCKKILFLTYGMFLNYLHMLQDEPQHWRTLVPYDSESIVCCMTKSRNLNEMSTTNTKRPEPLYTIEM